jgi:hypothetical protein
MSILFIIIILALSVLLLLIWTRWRRAVRADFIRSYALPRGLLDRLAVVRPELSLKERQLVAQALRQFFLAHLKSGGQFVSMPSQVADDLWHEFILYTRHYETFCNRAFGKFMHHTPAVALSADKQNNTGLRRTWWYCCREENINPKSATRLPLLFAIDEKFNIINGFRYVPDCHGVKRAGQQDNGGGGVYCGGDMSSSSFDGSTDGLGDSGSSFGDSASSDSGGDGGGCGGGGD